MFCSQLKYIVHLLRYFRNIIDHFLFDFLQFGVEVIPEFLGVLADTSPELFIFDTWLARSNWQGGTMGAAGLLLQPIFQILQESLRCWRIGLIAAKVKFLGQFSGNAGVDLHTNFMKSSIRALSSLFFCFVCSRAWIASFSRRSRAVS